VKTLLLMRHAKAVERDDFVAEHDRALAPRGETDAGLIGRRLRELGLIPDRALSSTAARAHRTCQLVVRELGKDVAVEKLRELYDAGSGGLLETIRRSGGNASTLLVVGHNPAIHAVAVALSASGDGEALAALRAKFPTGSVAVLRCGSVWDALAPGGAALEAFVRPKDLRE
jgi:phosphohistidine phosphatase